MTNIQAKQFNTRSELEAYIEQKYGKTTETKAHLITGTRAELKKLHLDDTKRVWGIPCEITDVPTLPTPQRERVDRGEQFDSKFNNVTKKKKNA